MEVDLPDAINIMTMVTTSIIIIMSNITMTIEL